MRKNDVLLNVADELKLNANHLRVALEAEIRVGTLIERCGEVYWVNGVTVPDKFIKEFGIKMDRYGYGHDVSINSVMYCVVEIENAAELQDLEAEALVAVIKEARRLSEKLRRGTREIAELAHNEAMIDEIRGLIGKGF